MPPKDMNQIAVEDREFPVLGPGQTIATVNEIISDSVLTRPYKKGWMIGAAIGFTFVNILFIAVAYLLFLGTGIWGSRVPSCGASRSSTSSGGSASATPGP